MQNIVSRTCGFSDRIQAQNFSRSQQAFNQFLLPSISSKSLWKTSSTISYAAVRCFTSIFFPFSLHAAPGTIIYPNLPFAVQERLDTVVTISRMSKSMRTPGAESLMQRFPTKSTSQNWRASKVMDHAGGFFGSTPLHDPQDAASILQNYHRAVFRKVYPASWSIPCILENQESRTHCLVHESCML